MAPASSAMALAIEMTELKRDLSRAEAANAMREMIEGRATDDETRRLLLALREKGATPDEIAGFARVMREHAVPVKLCRDDLIDVCGTGGDGASTFNISTTVAFVVAAAGVPVAKHGNRAVSSRCGSGDVLEALGLRVDATPDAVARSVERHGIGFFFAPTFHPALKRFAEVRRALKVRTIFNLLGPLANPAGVKRQLIGVYDQKLTETLARTLLELGSTDVLVVSADGLDELSLAGPTQASRLRAGRVSSFEILPSGVGLPTAPLSALAGGDSDENARIIHAIFAGEKGPRRNAVLFNSAAAFEIAGRVASLADGVALAAETIDSGRAAKLLKELRESA